MKYYLNVNLENITVVSAEEIELLQSCGVPMTVTQRKSYDEYHIDNASVLSELGLLDLQKLARKFKVEVTIFGIVISEL